MAPDGGAASATYSMPEFDALMELCHAGVNGEAVILPDCTLALIGRAWIS